jgi:hypothetical protein
MICHSLGLQGHVMNPFIRAVEIWAPNKDRSLEFAGGLYEGELEEFREISELALFSYDEGLPGKAWAAKHPIILTSFADTYFRRADEAKMFGLTCGIAIPIFAGDVLKAVLGLLCGSETEQNVGAIELWHNNADLSHELSLVDGYYGTADTFEFNSRHTTFPRGYGLPGRAWKADFPVIISELGGSRKFLRADDAAASGIRFGLAIPYSPNVNLTWVITFLSGSEKPIAHRFEIWKPSAAGDALVFEAGCCTRSTDLNKIFAGQIILKGEGTVGESWATGMPVINADLTQDVCAAAKAAIKVGLRQTIVLPVYRDAELSSVIAWYT